MDIYQQAAEQLGLGKVEFDENGQFSCELQNLQTPEAEGFVVSINKVAGEAALVISLSLQTPIPDILPQSFFMAFGEQAIEPARGGLGIGIFPGNHSLSLYQKVPLNQQHSDPLPSVFEQLLEAAELWEEKLNSLPSEIANHQPTAADITQNQPATRGLLV